MSLFGALGGIAKAVGARGFVGKLFGSGGKSRSADRFRKLLGGGGGGKKPPKMVLAGPGGKGGLPAVIPGAGRKFKKLRRIGGAIAAGVGDSIAIDAAGNLIQGGQRKRRRMNPCNEKALKRALRRIESFDRLKKRVDKSLRKACPPTRRRALPSRRKDPC